MQKTMSQSFGRIQLNNWMASIDINCDRFLDVGGSQLPCEKKFRKWNVKEYKILDLPQPHECQRKPDIECDLNKKIYSLHDFKTEPPTLLKDYFDVAFCGEVSEYLWNPVMAFENINLLLKKGGILYMSFHFIYPIHGPILNGFCQDFIRYTPFGIKKLLEETGFEIAEMKARVSHQPKHLFDFFQSEEMRPMKNYKYHHEVGHMVKAIKK